MKKILIATDFSTAADNATAFGVQLANVFNAGVILLNAYESMPVPVSEIPALISSGEIAAHSHRELNDTANILKARYQVAIHPCVKTGTAIHSILEAIKEHNADLVVVGMKSCGKERRRFFGSTVTALIRKSQTPILVIPEDVAFSHLTKLVLAIETDLPAKASPHLLDVLKDLSARFDSKLYLVHVSSTIAERAIDSLHPPLQLTKNLRGLDTQYKAVFGTTFFDGMNRFINENRINLLAIIPRYHALPERWFIGSTTKEMTFQTSIPLLVLPEKK